MEPRISLITLGVADLERATRFYQACLGLPRLETPPSVTFFELGKPGLRSGHGKAWPPMLASHRKARVFAASRWRITCARRRKWMRCLPGLPPAAAPSPSPDSRRTGAATPVISPIRMDLSGRLRIIQIFRMSE